MTSHEYQCAPEWQWVVETYGILLVHAERGACASLPYPAAAVWDFMSRGYRWPKIVQMLHPIGQFADAAASERYVRGCMETWAKAGWIRCHEGGGSDV